MIQNIKLLKKEVIAKNTMAFYWEKPDGFEFTAGQNGDFTLLNPPESDEEGNIRTFSFVNPPHENNLVIATRIRDTAFKRSLKNLPIGTNVKLAAPHGDFKLQKNTAIPAVFIIGGIGITPVLSMISDALYNKLPHKITLLYSNRTPMDAPFVSNLEKFADKNPNFKFVQIYSKYNSPKWKGEHGHIDSIILKKYISNIEKPIYYLSGPPQMVKTMYRLLVESGANEDNIKTEEFSGY